MPGLLFNFVSFLKKAFWVAVLQQHALLQSGILKIHIKDKNIVKKHFHWMLELFECKPLHWMQ